MVHVKVVKVVTVRGVVLESALLAGLPEQNAKYLVSLCFLENKRCEMDTAVTKCHWETLSMTKS